MSFTIGRVCGKQVDTALAFAGTLSSHHIYDKKKMFGAEHLPSYVISWTQLQRIYVYIYSLVTQKEIYYTVEHIWEMSVRYVPKNEYGLRVVWGSG